MNSQFSSYFKKAAYFLAFSCLLLNLVNSLNPQSFDQKYKILNANSVYN